ncbi:MAG: hypothetical protein KC442_03410 [Thermomicrobiales bacterium]|nr:hypothetical protein [Thermomicrobiales bacterium]MCB0059352.1 hypothetical protein [Caldilineaceae bacterium]
MSIPDLHRLPVAAAPELPELQTLEATAPQPTLRIRIEHSRTIKEGWSYSTTVEIDGVDVSDDSYNNAIDILDVALLESRLLGERERNTRNQRDAALKAGQQAGDAA